MKPIDTLIQAGWIVPVHPEGVVYEQHSLAVDSGQIIDVLPWDDAALKYHPAHLQLLPKHALVPGLVNVHTHAAMTLFRGLADDLPLMDWLQHHIWPAEQRWVDPEFVADGTLLAVAEMLRGGVTCFNDMYFFADQTARVATACGMRIGVGLIVLDFPTAWARDPQEYIDKAVALHDKYRHHSMVRTAFAPHAPYTVSDEPLAKLATLAEELDIPVHMHVQETAEEVTQSVDRHGLRPLERLKRLGLVSPRLLAVHMTQVTDNEIALLAEAGAHVLHCAESNLKLATGVCPVNKLLAAGVNVALGTDGAASNNDLDMLGEMRTAALLAKAQAGDPRAVPASTALRMATLSGAEAMGWADEIGSLEVGKAADVAAIHLGDIETQPLYHVVSQLVYAAARENVTDVWIAGRQVLRERRLTTVEEQQALQRAALWQQRISQHEQSAQHRPR